MDITLSEEQEAFVRHEVESGGYEDASGVVAAALAMLRDEEAWIEENREELRRMIRVGIDELDRGEYAEFDAEEMKARLRKDLDRKREAG